MCQPRQSAIFKVQVFSFPQGQSQGLWVFSPGRAASYSKEHWVYHVTSDMPPFPPWASAFSSAKWEGCELNSLLDSVNFSFLWGPLV